VKRKTTGEIGAGTRAKNIDKIEVEQIPNGLCAINCKHTPPAIFYIN